MIFFSLIEWLLLCTYCFALKIIIVNTASDGLWDVMSNQEAVDMVVDIILRENMKMYDGIDARERTMFPPSSYDNHNNKNDIDIDIYYNDHEAADGPFQEAAERLAVEAYVRGSTDNIGVCVVAVDWNWKVCVCIYVIHFSATRENIAMVRSYTVHEK